MQYLELALWTLLVGFVSGDSIAVDSDGVQSDGGQLKVFFKNLSPVPVGFAARSYRREELLAYELLTAHLRSCLPQYSLVSTMMTASRVLSKSAM